jgi:AraC-like DNA-binding protein
MHGNRTKNVFHRAPPLSHKLLRVGAAGFILELLAEQGIPSEPIFKRAGFSKGSYRLHQPILPVWRLGLLFKAAAAASAQAEFGLMVGLRAGSRLSDWGKLSAQGETKVGSTLMRIISEPTTFPNAFLTLHVAGDTCTLSCVTLPSSLIARDQLTDCAIGFAMGALRVLCGPGWHPLSTRFEHEQPPDASRHASLLQTSIIFDAEVSSIEFESKWLEYDRAISRARASDDVGGKRLDRDLAGEIHKVLDAWNGIGSPSAAEVASALGLTPRTLNRLLCNTGSSLSQILGDKQYEMARRMLQDPAVTVTFIAYSLGYANASTFSRAFRRWSGMTTSDWRKARGHDAS